MIISFFGHAKYTYDEDLLNKTLEILENVIGEREVEFLVGFHGNFENFGFKCALQYKKRHKNAIVTYVTPYLDVERFANSVKKCDCSIYPEIERTPLKFAIIKRNEWVIDRSDFIIFYKKYIGKTNDFFDYATRKNKKIVNLADL
ncbi:MAG: hypothetical protein IJW64_05700 [Clostridia bacterium]|nr:hypothetical protein [Clostridia bacterium]